MEKINESPPGKVYLVFGPTGVGKSTLCRRVENKLIEVYHDETEHNKGIIPVVTHELISSDNGKFNWKDFYRRMLKIMQEPLIDYKVASDKSMKNHRIPNHSPNTSPELRESLENALDYRETKVVLLDEAQHLLKVTNAKAIEDQMDAIKSLANVTGAIFVMFGTYELMQFFNLSGQIGRRSHEIHFPRYNFGKPRERKEFKSVINTFQLSTPLIEKSDLVQYWEFMYERTIGCVGILKEWLDLCVKEAVNKNFPRITEELLEKHAPSATKILKIAEEATNGEEKLEQAAAEDQFKLRNVLNMNKQKAEVQVEVSEKPKKKDVGKRNLNRDVVGVTESGA
ncbi:ATPase [Bacillus canaveralius]|uniref:ATPase n=1 Tax=Bacillus canaveralius TaxID=1403243 RepID=A0A2N5GMH7_9BACI|nr:ATP-binding protein [Bacillus canaveralius]PLR83034.1 ATPase [Bacillus canaveralius]PLR96962.1 ATPase [Bacillus canaveralius]